MPRPISIRDALIVVGVVVVELAVCVTLLVSSGSRAHERAASSAAAAQRSR